jgi:hypothetical protein
MILDRRQRGRCPGQTARHLLAVCLLITGCVPAWAQAPVDKPEGAGVLTLKSEPTGALIELLGEQKWKSMTPCEFNRGLKGPFELTASMRLYERWHRTISLAPGESREMTIRLKPKTPWKAGMRSLLVPGWGQFYSEQSKKGGLLLGATAIAAGGLLWTEIVYQDHVDDYEAARNAYFDSTQYDDLDDLRAKMLEEDSDAQDAYEWRQGFLYATAACWFVSFVDAVFFFPSRSEGSFATFRPLGDNGPDLALRPAPGKRLELALVLRESKGGAR